MSYLVWADLETTGLDERHDFPLEIGLIVTDERGNVHGEWSSLVMPQRASDGALINLNRYSMDPYVQNMHTESGLIADLEAAHSDASLIRNRVDNEAVSWLMTFGLLPNQQELCGSTVNFDRAFMRMYFPALFEFLHYRNIDVSTLKQLTKRLRPDLYNLWMDTIRPEPPAHRVLKDLDVTIREYKFYLDNFIKV